MYRRTKIVATVGPASESEQMLLALMEAGADVFRLNFSHGDHAGKARIIRRLRELSRQRRQAVAILADLQGPKIRVGHLREGALSLRTGQEVVLTTREVVGEGTVIPSDYKGLPKDVKPGDAILLDDGLLELRALAVTDEDVRCQVVVGGTLKDRKGINLPGARVSIPAMTEKDLEDLRFCLGQEIDYLALSFVQRAADVLELKERLYREKSSMRIIAKIEKPQAVEDFAAILEASDGIMVARGDLGVEMNPEKVPLIQKRIIRMCNEAGKPVITATQMLKSMTDAPRPTRAEVTDVTNAVLEGSDAVMLSEESAVGQYPVEAVQTMAKIAEEAEKGFQRGAWWHRLQQMQTADESEALTRAACSLSETIGAKALVIATQTGGTARLAAKTRPLQPILAGTTEVEAFRRLALVRGVRPMMIQTVDLLINLFAELHRAAKETGLVAAGDSVVCTAGFPLGKTGASNLIKVETVP